MSAGPPGTVAHPAQQRTGAAHLAPPLGWPATHDRRVLRADVVAGPVAAMPVPQSMAHASLAGMPPATGLYAAIVPLAVHSLLGTSGMLSVGPVAITSSMAAASGMGGTRLPDGIL